MQFLLFLKKRNLFSIKSSGHGQLSGLNAQLFLPAWKPEAYLLTFPYKIFSSQQKEKAWTAMPYLWLPQRPPGKTVLPLSFWKPMGLWGGSTIRSGGHMLVFDNKINASMERKIKPLNLTWNMIPASLVSGKIPSWLYRNRSNLICPAMMQAALTVWKWLWLTITLKAEAKT